MNNLEQYKNIRDRIENKIDYIFLNKYYYACETSNYIEFKKILSIICIFVHNK